MKNIPKHKTRKHLPAILIPAAVVFLLVVAGVVGVHNLLASLAEPAPVAPVEGTKYTVLCLGDSLTRGNCSADYTTRLSRRLEKDKIRVVNAGINGNMVHDVLARLAGVLEDTPSPEAITILIGTNDANATLDSNVAKRALENPAMGRIPDEPVYRTLYTELIERLRQNTDAPIILISIPPIGEVPGSTEWNRSAEYAAAVRDIAAAERCAYVPLFETLSSRIMKNPPNPDEFPGHEDWTRGMHMAVFRRHVLGKDYRTIGSAEGYILHSDQLHLNEEAAAILVDLLEPFVREAIEAK